MSARLERYRILIVGVLFSLLAAGGAVVCLRWTLAQAVEILEPSSDATAGPVERAVYVTVSLLLSLAVGAHRSMECAHRSSAALRIWQ